jgi:hypothetical protein
VLAAVRVLDGTSNGAGEERRSFCFIIAISIDAASVRDQIGFSTIHLFMDFVASIISVSSTAGGLTLSSFVGISKIHSC